LRENNLGTLEVGSEGGRATERIPGVRKLMAYDLRSHISSATFLAMHTDTKICNQQKSGRNLRGEEKMKSKEMAKDGHCGN
jgi:hypothetical protein